MSYYVELIKNRKVRKLFIVRNVENRQNRPPHFERMWFSILTKDGITSTPITKKRLK